MAGQPDSYVQAKYAGAETCCRRNHRLGGKIEIGSIGPQQMSQRHGDEHLARVFCTMAKLEDQAVGNLQKLPTGTRDLSAVPYMQNQIAGARRDVLLSLPVGL